LPSTSISFRPSSSLFRSFPTMLRHPLFFTLFPYTTLFRSRFTALIFLLVSLTSHSLNRFRRGVKSLSMPPFALSTLSLTAIKRTDRKSTRLNSSHVSISYAVFCLKKKKKKQLNNNQD